MPSYTLIYFEARGFGEVSRQLLHVAGKEFTDKRISMNEWPEFKKSKFCSTPFGHVPVLEVDGKPLPQSFAIARFLAREFGFAGKDAWESAWLDAIGDQFKDYFSEIRPFIYALRENEDKKQKALMECGEPARDKFFVVLEKQLSSNDSGFLVGSDLTWIDLGLADHVNSLENNIKGFLDAFPLVRAHRSKIHGLPKVAEWIAKRPDTPN